MNTSKKSTTLTFNPNYSPAIGISAFWTCGEGKLSKAITGVLDSEYSHMGLIFHLRNGRSIYYEALVGRGVVGPRDAAELQAWADADPRRKLLVVALPNMAACAELKQIIMETYVGMATYGEMQLLTMFAWERWGWKIRESKSRVVCSELCARILAPEMDLTDPQHPTPDYVSPKSALVRVRAILAPSEISNLKSQMTDPAEVEEVYGV